MRPPTNQIGNRCRRSCLPRHRGSVPSPSGEGQDEALLHAPRLRLAGLLVQPHAGRVAVGERHAPASSHAPPSVIARFTRAIPPSEAAPLSRGPSNHTYLCSRTPGVSPLVNSTPSASIACLSIVRVLRCDFVRPFSKSRTVMCDTCAAVASSRCDHFKSARPARHCSGVSIGRPVGRGVRPVNPYPKS